MKIIQLLIALTLVSCATVHRGKFAKQINKKKKKKDTYSYSSENKTDSGLMISYEWNQIYKDKHFRYLDFTFENQSDDWKKIQKIGIKFGKNTKKEKIFFLKGAPLAAFLKGKKLAIEIQAQNSAALAGALAGMSAAYSNANNQNNNYNNYDAGLVAMSTANNVLKNSKRAAKQFPEDHLFGSKDKFLIPPGLALRKYLVFYTKDKKDFRSIEKIFLTYQLKDGSEETLELEVKSYY